MAKIAFLPIRRGQNCNFSQLGFLKIRQIKRIIYISVTVQHFYLSFVVQNIEIPSF